ncbi:MAG TPA: cupin domain-containing protein [Gemmataceae bacterium]|jgi:quercetin dioxygenase-like cupin family protein|nr:cupin domain-containing protein [Gemmataceae bacterium]
MSRFFPMAGECGHHIIFGNIPIRTLAGEHLQLAVVDLVPGSVVEWHSHVNEQMGVLVSGQALFEIGDEKKTLEPGDMYYMPSNVRHRVTPVGGPARAVDVFYPIRDEYR